MGKVKLTEAQRDALALTDHPNGLRKRDVLGDEWRRLDRLVYLGLCELRTFDGYTYRITPAGRAKLAEERG